MTDNTAPETIEGSSAAQTQLELKRLRAESAALRAELDETNQGVMPFMASSTCRPNSCARRRTSKAVSCRT